MALDIPESCTLPTAERPLRLREFEALLTTAVHQVGRESETRLTLHLGGDESLEGQTRALVDREASCCSFFDFTVNPKSDGVVLGIGVPVQHADILDSLQAMAMSHS
jgi:hypothetical protein